MLDLPNVTLLCVETREPELAHWAIDRCLIGTRFAKVVLLTNLELVTNRRHGISYVQAPVIKNINDYSDLLLSDLSQYIEGSHVLVIQWDSFIIHPYLWTNEFLQYDYIGAVWPHHSESPVGNGGFSLRSKKLLQTIQQPEFVKKHPEDYCICVDNKEFLDRNNLKIAPVSVAEQFAVERSLWHKAFGFHGFFNFAKVLTDQELLSCMELMPQNSLSNLDAYELISSLKMQNRKFLALAVAKKINFKWKMRRNFIKLKWWELSNKYL